jgi:hypothetical protein
MFLRTKRSLNRSTEVSLSLHIFVLPSLLTRVLPGRVTPYPISHLDGYPDFYPKLCPIPYPSRYPEHYSSRYPSVLPGFLPEILPDSLPESLPGTLLESYPGVLPRALPEFHPDTYPIGLTRPYPRLTRPGKFLLDHVPRLTRFSYPAR